MTAAVTVFRPSLTVLPGYPQLRFDNGTDLTKTKKIFYTCSRGSGGGAQAASPPKRHKIHQNVVLTIEMDHSSIVIKVCILK